MQYLKSYSSSRQDRKDQQKQQLGMAEKSRLVLLMLIQTGLWGLTLIFLGFQTLRINALSSARPTFVQLVNGESLYISQRDRYFRQPQILQRFVTDWSTLTYNWDGKLPGTTDPDEGLAAPNGKKVTTNAWFASTMLEKGFSEKSLDQIATLTPGEVFSGNVQSVLLPTYVSEPRQIAPDTWEVDMTSTRQEINRRTGNRKPFEVNVTFTLKAVEPPRSPLGEKASFVEQRVYALRAAGLEITKITDFLLPNAK